MVYENGEAQLFEVANNQTGGSEKLKTSFQIPNKKKYSILKHLEQDLLASVSENIITLFFAS